MHRVHRHHYQHILSYIEYVTSLHSQYCAIESHNLPYFPRLHLLIRQHLVSDILRLFDIPHEIFAIEAQHDVFWAIFTQAKKLYACCHIMASFKQWKYLEVAK